MNLLLITNFTPSELKQKDNVFKHRLWNIENMMKHDDILYNKALENLQKSYTPYTKNPCGIVLEFLDNNGNKKQITCFQKFENKENLYVLSKNSIVLSKVVKY